MPTIKFTHALKRFYPDLQPMEVDVKEVHEVIDLLEKSYPGISGYIIDDQGILRQHVNIFVDGSMIKDRNKQTDILQENSEVYIMQALSGG